MIKGVNKRIIEINPKNEYFEKVILFINPSSKCSEQVLSSKADEYIEGVTKDVRFKSTLRSKVFMALAFLISASIGGGVALFVFGG